MIGDRTPIRNQVRGSIFPISAVCYTEPYPYGNTRSRRTASGCPSPSHRPHGPLINLNPYSLACLSELPIMKFSNQRDCTDQHGSYGMSSPLHSPSPLSTPTSHFRLTETLWSCTNSTLLQVLRLHLCSNTSTSSRLACCY